MRAYGIDVVFQCRGALFVRFGAGVAFVGDERDFGVDDHIFAVGHADDDIGTQPFAIGGDEAFLGGVFPPFLQSRLFEDAFQNEFAPGALSLGLAFEGVGEVDGVLADLLIEGFEVMDFVIKGNAVFGFFVVNLLHFAAKVLELVAQWVEHLVDVLFVLIGEFAAFVFQDLIGQVFEFGDQLGPGVLQQFQLFAGLPAFGGKLGFQTGDHGGLVAVDFTQLPCFAA